MMSTGQQARSSARGKLNKYELKCGFNQLPLDTQVFKCLQEVRNETGLFSFHLAKKRQQEKSPDTACTDWIAGRAIRGARLDGAAERSSRPLLLGQSGKTAYDQHTTLPLTRGERVGAVTAAPGLLAGRQWGGGGCAGASGSGVGSLPC